MAIDVDKLLSDISPDEPCGPDLSYDPDYLALLRLAEGTKGQSMGDAVIEGSEPNWRDVISGATETFGRTNDLNIALTLASASLAQHGIRGLRDGLKLVLALCEKHWDHFHPQLDPDDGNDPLERMNLIASLTAPIGQDGDHLQFRKRIREAPLASSRQLGQYGLRHVLMASGAIPTPEGTDQIDRALIDGAFTDTDPEELKSTADAAREAAEISNKLDSWLTNKVGAGAACDLKPWHDAIKEVSNLLSEQLANRGLGEAAAADPGSPSVGDAPAAGGAAASAAGPGANGVPGAINTRDDVITTLGKILEYYKRAEPSSPVPLLLHRARRLASMSFIDIIKDLSPDAMNQIRMVGGPEALDDTGASGAAGGDLATPPATKPTREPPKPVKLT